MNTFNEQTNSNVVPFRENKTGDGVEPDIKTNINLTNNGSKRQTVEGFLLSILGSGFLVFGCAGLTRWLDSFN